MIFVRVWSSYACDLRMRVKPAPHLRTFPWISASNLFVAQIRGIVRARCVSTSSHKYMELWELDVYLHYASKSYTAKKLSWWKDEYRRFVGSLCCAFYKRKKKKSNMDKRLVVEKGTARVHTSFAWVVALSRRCSYIPSNGWEFIFRITWSSSTSHWKAINGASVAYRSTPEINGNFEIFGHWWFIPRPQIFNSYLGPSIEQHHPWNVQCNIWRSIRWILEGKHFYVTSL